MVAKEGVDPPSFGLWAQRASAALLCFLWVFLLVLVVVVCLFVFVDVGQKVMQSYFSAVNVTSPNEGGICVFVCVRVCGVCDTNLGSGQKRMVGGEY